MLEPADEAAVLRPDLNSPLLRVLGRVQGAKKVDDFTVDLQLEKPMPLLLRNIVDFRIVSANSRAEQMTGRCKADLRAHAVGFVETHVPHGWANDTEYTWALRAAAGPQ